MHISGNFLKKESLWSLWRLWRTHFQPLYNKFRKKFFSSLPQPKDYPPVWVDPLLRAFQQWKVPLQRWIGISSPGDSEVMDVHKPFLSSSLPWNLFYFSKLHLLPSGWPQLVMFSSLFFLSSIDQFITSVSVIFGYLKNTKNTI